MLTQMVNGVVKTIDPAEEAQIRAEWAINKVQATQERQAKEALENATKTILATNQGQGVGVMSLPQLSQMVIAIGQRLGIVDENGDVI